MSISPVTSKSIEQSQSELEIDLHPLLEPVFKKIDVEKLDSVIAYIKYEIDWDTHGKRAVNIVAHVTRMQTQILGYLPVVGVASGACQVSLASLQLGLIGAGSMLHQLFGGSSADYATQALKSYTLMKKGTLNVMPLAVGLLAYLKDYAPSVELMVSDLKCSPDKVGVLSEYYSKTCEEAFKDKEESYTNYKPWAQKLSYICDKTYLLAVDGADVMVTCSAWGDLALGASALALAPFAGSAALSYGIGCLSKGVISLGASAALEIAEEYQLKSKIITWLFGEEKQQEVPHISDSLTSKIGDVYEAIKKLN